VAHASSLSQDRRHRLDTPTPYVSDLGIDVGKPILWSSQEPKSRSNSIGCPGSRPCLPIPASAHDLGQPIVSLGPDLFSCSNNTAFGAASIQTEQITGKPRFFGSCHCELDSEPL
jgi:hypothetical protein